jgi:hypothetical protein
VVDRVRVRLVETLEQRRVEIALDGRVVCGELIETVGVLGPVTEDDVHRLRRCSLQPLEMCRVLAQLQQRLGADPARELGVRCLVGEPPPGARRVDTHEEVRTAEPAAVEECRLVDDVIAVTHRLDGLGLEGAEVRRRARIPITAVFEGLDPQPALGERLEVVLLVSGAETREHLAERRGIARNLLACGNAPLERDEVAACEIVAEVGRRVDGTPVLEEPHQRSILARRRPRSRGNGRRSWRTAVWPAPGPRSRAWAARPGAGAAGLGDDPKRSRRAAIKASARRR